MLGLSVSAADQQLLEQLLVPTLQEVVRNLDPQGIMQLRGVLCSRVEGVPFLLQPLVVSSTIVQASPPPNVPCLHLYMQSATSHREAKVLSGL